VNILNCLYHAQDVNIPVAFEIIKKSVRFYDETLREKRKSKITKDELMRKMLKVCINNQLIFKYVLADTWFSSKENMSFIKLDLHKDFIIPIKSNRTIALSLENKQKGRFVRVDALPLKPNRTLSVYLKGVKFPVALCKQVFTNRDDSEGILYLVKSDIHLSYSQIMTIYQIQLCSFKITDKNRKDSEQLLLCFNLGHL